MPAMILPDVIILIPLAAGALAAGFVSGFSGFGAALVASGFWFLAVPAEIVPPLVVSAGMAGQVLGYFRLRRTLAFGKASALISGGVLGVPIGVALLSVAAPEALRLVVGVFLIGYTAFQASGLSRISIGGWGGKTADRGVGFLGGILGGFAGLSGPLPLIWVQLRGIPTGEQRAYYQPFNLIMLGLAWVAMALAGKMDATFWPLAMVVVPLTLLGAAIGVRAYQGSGEILLRRVLLGLLFAAGCVLIWQSRHGAL